MRAILVALFVLTVTLLAGWFNYYFMNRWFPAYRRGFLRYGYLLATIGACVIVGYGWSLRAASLPWPHESLLYLAYGAFAWIIAQVLLLLFLPVIYLLRRLLAAPASPEAAPETVPSISRRRFLQGALAAAPLVAIGVGADGVYSATAAPVVRRFSFDFPGAPPGLKGFKLAQVSDIHMGAYFSLEQLARVISTVKAEKPDLVVVSGDFIDDLNLLTPALGMLAGLQPEIPHGVYFCWGNHEYFRDIGRIRRQLLASPITLLDNESALIIPGKRPFYLLGVDYPWTNPPQSRRRFLEEAKKNVPPEAFTVLVAHHPDFLYDGFAGQIPLTLAGHTHGGQVVIGGKTILPFPYHYMRGLYEENGVYGYVSSGVGHWVPFRLGCPPEISVFTLNAG